MPDAKLVVAEVSYSASPVKAEEYTQLYRMALPPHPSLVLLVMVLV
jgi:hypothetical protein